MSDFLNPNPYLGYLFESELQKLTVSSETKTDIKKGHLYHGIG